ncbi:LysR family transcriptional regulator [Bowmanella yangjiangensis]|uniref:LysR family transcriptional regulator n=1 Tax=Bowmanella yangjiangensis TaxID=2811230 RepID=UPI001E2E345A|nr:LysR substrate-binding domain-containing protein [Bowmanella yangjiangensis]
MYLNLHLLRIFMHVAELGSFSRAAEQLAITQPAVSKGVTELESQLSLALLERTSASLRGRRQWQLTEHGRALLEHAKGIFALERAAIDDLQARLDCQRGHLHLGASSTIAGYWLADVFTRFCAQYPDVQVSAMSGNTEEICQALLDCRLDLALVEGQVSDPRIAVSHWYDEPLKLVCPADWQVNGKNLNRLRWLWREPGSGTRSWMEQHLQDAGIVPESSLEIGSNEGIARAVAAGLGLSILPLKVCEELLTLGRLQVLDTAWSKSLYRPLFLLQLQQRPLSPLAQAFKFMLSTN